MPERHADAHTTVTASSHRRKATLRGRPRASSHITPNTAPVESIKRLKGAIQSDHVASGWSIATAFAVT